MKQKVILRGQSSIQSKKLNDWFFLFNYYCVNIFKLNIFYKNRRVLYRKYLETHSLSGSDAIMMDLQRINLNSNFLNEVNRYTNEKHIFVLKRILLLFASLNSHTGYVQGMHMILLPIYNFLYKHSGENAEADSFFCFTNLIARRINIFCKEFDNDLFGINYYLNYTFTVLKKIDKKLYEHFKSINILKSTVHFKWIVLMFSQEYSLDDVVILWNDLLRYENIEYFLVYFCVAIFIFNREILLNMEFEEAILYLQNGWRGDIHVILFKAKEIKRQIEMERER